MDGHGWVKENEANLHSKLRIMLLKLPANTRHRGRSLGAENVGSLVSLLVV